MSEFSPSDQFVQVFRTTARLLREHLELYVDAESAARVAGQSMQDLFLFAWHDEATRWGTYQRLYQGTEYNLRRVKERAGSYLPATYLRSFPIPCRVELCRLAGAYATITGTVQLAGFGVIDRLDAAAAVAAIVERDQHVGAVWYGHREIQRGRPLWERFAAALDGHQCTGEHACTTAAATWEREDVRSQIWRDRSIRERGLVSDGCRHEVHHPHRADSPGRDDLVVSHGSVRLAEPEHGVGSDGQLAAHVGGDS